MPRASLDKQPHDVATMFDGIARRYDVTNDVMSLGQDRAWRAATLRALEVGPGDRVLDLAAGTGTSSEPLADRGVHVVPCDLSLGMLGVGKRRRPDLGFVAGDATRLPFADESFDAVTISFGLRNVVDTERALTEMLRVTRPGGRLVVCEFSHATWAPFRHRLRELPHAGAADGRHARSPRRPMPTPTSPSPSAPGRTSVSSLGRSGTPAGRTSPTATSPAAWSRCTGRPVHRPPTRPPTPAPVPAARQRRHRPGAPGRSSATPRRAVRTGEASLGRQPREA